MLNGKVLSVQAALLHVSPPDAGTCPRAEMESESPLSCSFPLSNCLFTWRAYTERWTGKVISFPGSAGMRIPICAPPCAAAMTLLLPMPGSGPIPAAGGLLGTWDLPTSTRRHSYSYWEGGCERPARFFFPLTNDLCLCFYFHFQALTLQRSGGLRILAGRKKQDSSS